MRSKRPLPAKKPPVGCPGWMMTFGDCMSLLVTFFVMLIAFSHIEEESLAVMIGALRGAFGAMAVELGTPVGAVQQPAITDVERSEAEKASDDAVRGESKKVRFLTAEEMTDAIPNFIDEIQTESHELVSDRILIQMLDEGLAILLRTNNLFEEGSAVLQRDLRSLWQGINRLLYGRDNEIRITAVTSATAPVRREVAATSWGLGILRADHIAQALQTAMSSPAGRFGVGVELYDDQTRVVSNDYVEIMIMEPKRVEDLGTESAWPKGIWR